MNWVDLLGYTGAVTSCVLFLPQARRTFLIRHDPLALEGVSIATTAVLLANAAVWLVWAVAAQAYPAGIPSLVNIPVGIFTLTLLLRWRRGSDEPLPTAAQGARGDSRCPSCGWDQPNVPHLIEITAPPGAGSLVPCPGGTGALPGRPVAATIDSR